MKVQKVSLEQIAIAAGVHKATVSRALRNHPTIPKATRERVKAIAEKLGYRPNPFVAMFQAQARSSRPARMQAILAWVNDYPNPDCWRDFPWLRGYHEGALQRCEQMGYRLQQIDLSPSPEEADNELARMTKVLRQEGIYGLVLPLVLNARYLQAPLQNCVVSIIGGGHKALPVGAASVPSRYYPQNFPAADRDLYYNARLTYQNLLGLGYTRIGFVYSHYLDAEADGRTRAGFLIEQSGQHEACRIPILFLQRFKEGRPPEFDEWFHRHMPEAIICVSPSVKDWVEEMGLSVPGDVGIANLNIVEDVSNWSGVNENHVGIGAAAVDLILSALSRNEIGVAPQPRKILVPGRWVQGRTLRAPLTVP